MLSAKPRLPSPPGRSAAARGEHLAQAVPEVGLDAGVALLEGEQLVAGVRRPHVAGRHRVHPADPGVVGPVPHQLDRLAHRLADLGGLERGVEEEPAAERAAALHDVHLDLVLGQPDRLGDRRLGRDRSLERRPDLGPVGPDVGDRRVGVEGGVAAEVEGERRVDGLGQRGVGHGRHRQLGLLQLGLDVAVGQPGDRPVGPLDPHRPDRVDALSEGVGPHRHAGVDDRDVVHSAHPRHLRAVEQPLRGAVERRSPADHGRQRVLDPQVGGERLLAGHRIVRVESVLAHTDHPERARCP